MDEGPIRTCAGCRTKRPRSHLIRVVQPAEGEPYPDVTSMRPASGGGSGRGAYVCFDARCIRRALTTGSLGRALRSTRSLPPELGDTLISIAEERRRDG